MYIFKNIILLDFYFEIIVLTYFLKTFKANERELDSFQNEGWLLHYQSSPKK